MDRVYAIIMAGGRGERFWPLSTDPVPKPFLRLTADRTLIQQTVDRLQPLIPLERILVSIGEAHRQLAYDQLPELPRENFIVEPVGRDTAACIGFSALHVERREPDGTMLALPADHFVSDPAAFRRTLATGIRNLEGASGVVFGILPERPETGYGYILAEKPALAAEYWPVLRFVEKPDADTAKRYLASSNYFWNSGMFLWEIGRLLRLFRNHMPELHTALDRLRTLIGKPGTQAELLEAFSSLPRISIDYGIMEKASGLRLVPAEFAWDDIGNWRALERSLPADANNNIGIGPSCFLQTAGCITYSDAGAIAVFGLSDLVVVQARGRVLVCHKEKAADLKQLLAVLDSASR